MAACHVWDATYPACWPVTWNLMLEPTWQTCPWGPAKTRRHVRLQPIGSTRSFAESRMTERAWAHGPAWLSRTKAAAPALEDHRGTIVLCIVLKCSCLRIWLTRLRRAAWGRLCWSLSHHRVKCLSDLSQFRRFLPEAWSHGLRAQWHWHRLPETRGSRMPLSAPAAGGHPEAAAAAAAAAAATQLFTADPIAAATALLTTVLSGQWSLAWFNFNESLSTRAVEAPLRGNASESFGTGNRDRT